MRLVLWNLQLLAMVSTAQAQEYDAMIREALNRQRTRKQGEAQDEPYHHAYLMLARAAKAQPNRWEAFALRGENRCVIAVMRRGILAQHLNGMVARGASQEEILGKQQLGLAMIEKHLGQARQDFFAMENVFKRRGINDPNTLLFARALQKWAGTHYVTVKGVPGAIDDLKELVRRKWKVEVCSEYIARASLEQGAVLYVMKEYERARDMWREGLKWAKSDDTTRSLLTQIAGAMESGGQLGEAKRVLRELIDREPHRPGHWKNLGLLLGQQGAKREALHAYGKVRELCEKAKTSFFLGQLYGSSWLNAATIHGKLLTRDGDLLVAWDLFLEYREMFGDDYNFCFKFGDFLLQMGQYELAAKFVERARKLHPFCKGPHLLMLQLAPRLNRTGDEIKKLIDDAKAAIDEVKTRRAGPNLVQLCAGLIDKSDAGTVAGRDERMSPDPLEGLAAGKPPAWLVQAAKSREPFEPWEPPPKAAAKADEPGAAEPSSDGPQASGGSSLALVVGLAALAAAVALVVWFRAR